MNNKNLLLTLATAALAVSSSLAAQGTSSPYSDPAGDIDPGISTGNGTLDILGMEVINDANDITFTLTVNGNVSTTVWGKFIIGISTGSTVSTNTGNGWIRDRRPIQLNSPVGGMDHWVGSWVDSGSGAWLYNYDGTSWQGDDGSASIGFSIVPGTTSTLSYHLTLASLGLAPNDVFYFDAYSTAGGPGGNQSAVDALANPNVSITSWEQAYTSTTIDSGGAGLNSYRVVPEPSTYALLLMTGAGALWMARRRR